MKAKIFPAIGLFFACSFSAAVLTAEDKPAATPAPAPAAPNFTFVSPDDPAVAELAAFGSKTIEQVGALLVSEVGRELATKETSLAVGVLHLKGLELPKPVAGKPTITAVKRTSLLVRNPENNPDAADLAALNMIQDQIENGDTPAKMLVQKVDHAGAAPEWRVYRPIATMDSCLACHGDPDTFRPGVREALDHFYPNDQAVGYRGRAYRGVIRVSLADPAVTK